MPIDYSHWQGKPKRACFNCRKCFKDRTYYHFLTQTKTCPHCGGELQKMGTHFKAPKRSDDKAWEAIEMLYAAGVRYDVFDWHQHYWPEAYKTRGTSFAGFAMARAFEERGWDYLDQVLGDIGIRIPSSDEDSTEPKRAVTTERYHPHQMQWRGPRPTHPRDVPAFLEWWREQGLDRIRIAVEACEKLGYEPPEGLRGELLLEEMRKRFDNS